MRQPRPDAQPDLAELIAEHDAALARLQTLVGEFGAAIESERELQAEHEQRMRQLDGAASAKAQYTDPHGRGGIRQLSANTGH